MIQIPLCRQIAMKNKFINIGKVLKTWPGIYVFNKISATIIDSIQLSTPLQIVFTYMQRVILFIILDVSV